jgi:predicted branched-subunit amino acid permease
MRTRPSPYAIPGLLAVSGLGVLLGATGGAFWPFALAWLVAILALITLTKTIASSRSWRAALAAVVVVACPVLTFEGGLFLLPAALALLLIEARRANRASRVSQL